MNEPLPIPRDDLLDSPEDLLRFVHYEMFKELERDYLQEVVGPLFYGDPENYEVYMDGQRTWQIRAAPHHKPNAVIGMMNFLADIGIDDERRPCARRMDAD